jgi:hypothetical protein
MKLQRWDVYIGYWEPDEPTIGHDKDDCGDWVKASDAEALEQENERLKKRVAELEQALEHIKFKSEYESPCYCYRIAKKALGETEDEE